MPYEMETEEAIRKKEIEHEKVNQIIKDIQNLKEKLLYTATKEVKPEYHEGKNIAEIQHKQEIRSIRSILKDKLTTMEMVKEAEKWQEQL